MTYDEDYDPIAIIIKVDGNLQGKANIYAYPSALGPHYLSQKDSPRSPSISLTGRGKIDIEDRDDFYMGNHAYIFYIPEKGAKGKLTIKAHL